MKLEENNTTRKDDEMGKLKKISNIMLMVSVFNILWFTIVAIVLQFTETMELSSTLITCWYTFWTVEIFSMAGIKISKVKNPEIETEVCDESAD